MKCEECGDTYCGECHYQHLNNEDRKEYVFEKPFLKNLLPSLIPFTNIAEPFPEFGFLIRKKYLKK